MQSPRSRAMLTALRSYQFAIVIVAFGGASRTSADEPRKLSEFGGWVTAVAFSPDGQTLASSGGQTLLYRPGDVILWDAASGAQRSALTGHTACVWNVAYSSDGLSLATAAYDKSAILWDLAAGTPKFTLSGHKNWVTAVAFSPDGKQLATSSEDGTVKLWDTSNGSEQGALTGHTATVRSVAFSPDGQTIATASWDKTVRLWTVADRAEKKKIEDHTDAVWTVRFSPDGKLLASAGADRSIRLHDASTGEAKSTWSAHTNWITSLAFSPDGKQLASTSFDHTARLWDASTAQQVAEFGTFSGTAWSAAFSPDGKLLAAGDQGTPCIRVWDVETKQERFPAAVVASTTAAEAAEAPAAPDAAAPAPATAPEPAPKAESPATPAPSASTPVAADSGVLGAESLAPSVTIYRDSFGVPHIDGPTDASVVFGFAYAQAEDYFWQIEDTYLMCLGRYAEVTGIKGLNNDLLNRAFEVVRTAQESYAQLAPNEQAVCQAFVAGLNHYLAKHPETKPRALEKFEPWMVIAFSRHLTIEMAYGHTGQDKKYFPDGHDQFWKLVGSNAWAVAPEKTANKVPLLVANPHQPWYGFGQFYEGHLRSGEGWNYSGATFFGSPLPTIGHNEHLGWTMTVNEPDIADAWIETFDDPARPLAYRYGDGYREAVEWRDTVRIKRGKQMEAREYVFRKTHHGPLVAKRGTNQQISVRIAKLYDAVLVRQLLQLVRAKNLSEFRAGLALQNFAFMNTVYADREGNIYYVYNGIVPRRDPQFDWRQPVDGSDPRTEWNGYHSLDELPQVLNPPSGFVQSCNSSPFTTTDDGNPSIGDYPAYLAEDRHDDKRRAMRSRQFLRELNGATFEQLQDAVFDSEIYWARSELPKFAREFEGLRQRDAKLATDVEPYLKHLLDWDGRATRESTQAMLLIQWYEELYGFGYPAETLKPEFLAAPDQRFAALIKAAEKLKTNFGRWDVAWGEANRIQRHPNVADFYEIPFSDRLPSLPSHGAQGPPGTLFTMYYTPSITIPLVRQMKKHYGVVGLSYVSVMEFGPKVRAATLVQFGQSGDPASPHYFDQAQLLSDGKLKPELFHWEDVVAGARRTYHPGDEVAQPVAGGAGR